MEEIMRPFYALRSPEFNRLPQSSKSWAAAYVEDEDVVGLDRHVKAVIDQLELERSRMSVMSIVGMCGVGKTTLATKVFNTLRRSSSGFGCTAWISLSRLDHEFIYSPLNLLRSVASEILKLSPKDEQEMNEDAISQSICQFLLSKKYLIVLDDLIVPDDVWSSQVWDTLRNILPDTNGSRVIITTVNAEIARLANPNTYELPALDERQSRVLFTKRAFPNEDNAEQLCSGAFAGLREEIVKNCGGLPLAIIVVGGLLSVREDPSEWRKVSEKMASFRVEGDPCRGVLALSYTYLPIHLRRCLMYLAAIPKDCEVHAKRLMRLWIAEGFIEVEDENFLEETAERYLEELVQRCLIQVVKRVPYGSVEVCRVHDLLLKFVISEAKKTIFLDVLRTANDMCPRTLLRRLSMTSACIKGTAHLPLESNKLRSLLIMDPEDWKRGEDTYLVVENVAGNIEWSAFQRNLKLLRVLELGVYVHQLPDEIENMVNLRYLSLSSYETMELPKSLGNLRHLQTLDVGTANVSCLPVSIWRIKTLRYLRGGWETRIPAPETHRPIDGFQDLRALRHVRAHPWMEKILPELSNLRELEICRDRDGSIPDYLCRTIKGLQSMKVLILVERNISYGCKSALNMDKIFLPSNSHEHLHTLELSDLKFNSSNLRQLPQNLKQVKLAQARIDHGLIELLGKLPSLHLLKLIEVSIVEEEMIFESGWFLQLIGLILDDLNIKTWELNGQSLPLLRELEISQCSLLQALPESLPPRIELNIVQSPRLQALEILRPISSLKSSTLQGVLSQLHEKFTAEDRNKEKLEGAIATGVLDITSPSTIT